MLLYHVKTSNNAEESKAQCTTLKGALLFLCNNFQSS